MNYAAAWYLVMVASGQYIGPIGQEGCSVAAASLQADGVICRQADLMTTCPVPGMVGVVTACPVFDFPKVTRKP